MKKWIVYLFSCCICMVVFLFAVSTQNKTVSADTTAIAESDSVIEEMTVLDDNCNVITYQLESGYAKALKKYSEIGQDSFKPDKGIDINKLTLKFKDRNYICWFLMSENEDKELKLSYYKNQFENTEWKSAEQIEQYLDDLLQKEEIGLYICQIGAQSENIEDRVPYTSSWIVE